VPDRCEPPAAGELEQIAAAAARAAAALATETGRRDEDPVRRLLREATPGAGARLEWVIDPLDGTVNFVHGVPLFAVSIASAVDGEVVAGAVVDVSRDELFSAHLGGGARLDGEQIAVSECTSLARALVATGFSYPAGERIRQGEVAQRLLSRARDVRCFGSTALELCWVASGRVDAYCQRDTALWGRAAGALIAAEAGAGVELPCPENDDLVLVAGTGIFEELRGLVQFAWD
jgi:myo-inositol-1(or 4)-monophosphatase